MEQLRSVVTGAPEYLPRAGHHFQLAHVVDLGTEAVAGGPDPAHAQGAADRQILVGFSVLIFDVVGVAVAAGLALSLVVAVARSTRRLYDLERL